MLVCHRPWSPGFSSSLVRIWAALALVGAAAAAASSAVAAEVAAEPAATNSAQALPLGTPIADFRLRDWQGKEIALSDLATAKAVVVAFWGTECPLARLYTPRLAELARTYRPQGVEFLAIDANRQDSLADMAAMARLFELPFPWLKDVGNVVADQFAAERTPQVFLLDGQRRLVYRGRIDDQFAVGLQRPHPSREDLREALDDVLAARAVRVAETTPTGCLIGRTLQPQVDSQVTWSHQISRLMARRCVECHRAGEVGPMALESYDEVVGWAEMIGEVVEQGRMPPWHADPAHGTFSNDSRLTDEERSLVRRWVAAGAPQGDPAQLPEPRQFPVGWQLPRVDRSYELSRRPARIPAEGILSYYYFTIDPGFEQDQWISGLELRPGNRSVVHHILLFEQPKGEIPRGHGGLTGYLGCYVPGARPLQCPPGMAKRIRAGSQIVAQVHYVTTGTPQTDQSQLGLMFADPAEITREVRTSSAMSVFFAIPPHAAHHQLRASHRFRQDTLLLSMFPHMHLRGKAFRYRLRYPDGREEVLLDVPRYDFNWQHSYLLAEPKLIPAGSRMLVDAVFDNSADNPANPDPSQTVTSGLQTADEMQTGYFDQAVPTTRPGTRGSRQPPPQTASRSR